MSIVELEIENFKGINDLETVDVSPITVFLGPNSSGKSTCIHALALLSQTLKLPNNLSPLTLDDEYAYVHLGRWIEVLHRRSYAERLRLGLRLSEQTLPDVSEKGEGVPVKGRPAARFWFKCSLRTQEISLEQAEYEFGTVTFSVRRDGAEYRVTRSGSGTTGQFERRAGFLLQPVFQRGKKGGLPLDLYLFSYLQAQVQRELLSTLYLGPFRKAPSRRYPTRGVSPTEVGSEGEAATTMLANEVVKRQNRPHVREIAGWLSTLGLAKTLDVVRLGRSDLFDLNLTLADGEKFPIADLGYGLSQVLPVLAQCSFAPAGATLLFEQPELHLHPLAARPLAETFTQTVSKGRTVVLETHSPEVIHGLQEEVSKKTLKAEDVSVYLVSRHSKKTILRRVAISDDGDIQENWERGLSKSW